MTDLRTRFGFILALALLPLVLFSIYMLIMSGEVIPALLSISALGFAYIAIWIATDKLVFSYLRRIETASDQFASGDMDARVGDMEYASERIHNLGQAFDHMADNISEREARLMDNLHEKETLMREIHHRVKNNLQIIISLLNMQERKLEDSEGIRAIQETRSRINAIALVHRGLYEGRDLRVINMRPFLERLLNELKIGLGVESRNIEISLAVECNHLEPDIAIPVSLFLVESLTNSVKHGVSKGGHIDISVHQDEDIITVTVSDNGVGSAKAIKKGTGSKLIKGFARQLSGKIITDANESGYSTSLIFKPDMEPIFAGDI